MPSHVPQERMELYLDLLGRNRWLAISGYMAHHQVRDDFSCAEVARLLDE
jgi:hypothetical protein